MTRIIHLSDPHFGTVPDGLADALARRLHDLRPDLTVLSGDLTQRARPAQFRAARAFLSACPAPVLAIPGNHDTPLWHPHRLLAPWSRWDRHLTLPRDGGVTVGDTAVVALNTADPRRWKDGTITAAQLETLARAFAATPARRRIVALHHSPEPARGEPPSLHGAPAAIAAFRALGVGMVLSGHLHFTHIAPLTAAPAILSIQAGTCLSDRTRGDGNAFTCIDLTATGARLTHHRATTGGSFQPDLALDWDRGPQGWRPVRPVPPSPAPPP